jgi:formate/nitrite transporter FocA (FNT family)
MFLRFYTDTVSKFSRAMSAGIFITGLLLIGFGVLIAAFPQFFAYIAAGVFFIAGFGCIVTAAKILLTQRRLSKLMRDDSYTGRENVRIRIER